MQGHSQADNSMHSVFLQSSALHCLLVNLQIALDILITLFYLPSQSYICPVSPLSLLSMFIPIPDIADIQSPRVCGPVSFK